MDSTTTRVTLVAALLVLVAALGALVNRPDSQLAQDDVEFEVLSGVLVDNGSPGASRSASSAQVQNRPAQTGGSGGSQQGSSVQQGPPGGPGSDGPPGGPPSSVPPGPPDHAAQPRTFGIAGNVSGLYPGIDGTLVLTVSNQHNFDIVVTEVTVAVSEPTFDGPGTCAIEDIDVTDFSGSQLVERQDTAEIELDITMLHSATDACQGATWELTYTGTATRANQQ